MTGADETTVISCLRRLVELAAPGRPRDCWIDPLLTHPRFPNAAAIIDALRTAGVDCAAVRAEIDQLAQFPAPALLFLESGEIAVLEGLDANGVGWTHQRHGRQRVGHDELQKQWRGIALVIEHVAAEPPGSCMAPRMGASAIAISAASLVATIVAIACSAASDPLSTGLLVSDVSGAAVSLLLGWRNAHSRLGAALCPPGSLFDCGRVLDSRFATFAGIPLADWAAGYFLTCAIATAFAAAAGTLHFALLAWLALVAMLAAAASLVVQVFVLRAWCLGCLVIDALILSRGVLLWRHCGTPDAREAAITLLALCLSVVLLAIRNVVPPAVADERRRYLRLKRNPAVLATLLATRRRLPELPLIMPALRFGTDAAAVVTLVTNPYCRPCAEAHSGVAPLVDRGFQLRLVFLCDPDLDVPGVQVVVSAHALAALGRDDEARHLIEAWFSAIAQNRPFDDSELHRVSATLTFEALARARTSVRTQSRWAAAAGVEGTPFVALNGREMPPQYSVADLADMDVAELARHSSHITEC